MIYFEETFSDSSPSLQMELEYNPLKLSSVSFELPDPWVIFSIIPRTCNPDYLSTLGAMSIEL
jgi:hypothetical protein